jgi:hypothetical protein
LGDRLGLLHVKGLIKTPVPHVIWERQPKGAPRSQSYQMKTSLEKWKKKVEKAVVLVVHDRKGGK